MHSALFPSCILVNLVNCDNHTRKLNIMFNNIVQNVVTAGWIHTMQYLQDTMSQQLVQSTTVNPHALDIRSAMGLIEIQIICVILADLGLLIVELILMFHILPPASIVLVESLSL